MSHFKFKLNAIASRILHDRAPHILIVFPEDETKYNYMEFRQDWPLVINMEICESDTGNVVFNSDLDKNHMVVTNWHEPHFSVMLEWRELSPNFIFKPEKQYTVIMKVVQPYVEMGKADIYLHWLE